MNIPIPDHLDVMYHGGHGKVLGLNQDSSPMVVLLEHLEHPPLCGHLLLHAKLET